MLYGVGAPQSQAFDILEGEPLFGEKGGSPASEALGVKSSADRLSWLHTWSWNARKACLSRRVAVVPVLWRRIGRD